MKINMRLILMFEGSYERREDGWGRDD